jgi:hypothetical protein
LWQRRPKARVWARARKRAAFPALFFLVNLVRLPLTRARELPGAAAPAVGIDLAQVLAPYLPPGQLAVAPGALVPPPLQLQPLSHLVWNAPPVYDENDALRAQLAALQQQLAGGAGGAPAAVAAGGRSATATLDAAGAARGAAGAAAHDADDVGAHARTCVRARARACWIGTVDAWCRRGSHVLARGS